MVRACCVTLQRGESLVLGGRASESKDDSHFFQGGCSLTKAPQLAWLAFEGAEAEADHPGGILPSLLGLFKAVFPSLSHWPVPLHLFLHQDGRHSEQGRLGRNGSRLSHQRFIIAQGRQVAHSGQYMLADCTGLLPCVGGIFSFLQLLPLHLLDA